jgi:hypothetical protein
MHRALYSGFSIAKQGAFYQFLLLRISQFTLVAFIMLQSMPESFSEWV